MVQRRTCTGLGAGDFSLSGKQYLKMNVSSLLYAKFYCVLAVGNSPDCTFLAGVICSMICVFPFLPRTQNITSRENQRNGGQLLGYLALSLGESSERAWGSDGKDAKGGQNLMASFLSLSVKTARRMSS